MKKRLKVFVGIISPLVLLAILLCWLVMRDGPPPDDAHLKDVPLLKVSEAQNAANYFEIAAGYLNWADEGARVDEILADWQKYEPGFVRDMLHRNKDVADYIRDGLACEYDQAPQLPGVEAVVPHAAAWGGAVRVLALRSVDAWRRGQHAESLDSAMMIVRFGDRLQDCRSRIGYYQLGGVFKEYGAEILRTALPRLTRLRAEELQLCAGELADYANPKGLENTLKCEYMALGKAIDAMADGTAQPTGAAKFPANVRVGHSGFQPNKTKSLLATGFTELVANASRPAASMSKAASIPGLRAVGKDGLTERLRGNPRGIEICRDIAGRMDAVLLAKCHEEVSVSATRVLVALKGYRVAHRKLPASLGDLAPEFLAIVPRDAYDGKPLRYSPEKRVVYSVGEDLYDSTTPEEQVPEALPEPPKDDTEVQGPEAPAKPAPPAVSDDIVFEIKF